MQEIKQCPSCGSNVNPMSQFCFHCGRGLQADPSPLALSFAPTSQPAVSPDAPALTPLPPESPPRGSYLAPAAPNSTPAGEPSVAEPMAPSSPRPAEVMCSQHPMVPAVQRCASCGISVCLTCDFVVPAPNTSSSMLQLGRDMHLCPNCMSARRSGAAGRPVVKPLGAGIMCARHSAVQAIRRCDICHTPMCQTCDFELPGYFHVCPACATNPKREMSSSRKRNLILALVLAAWATLGLALTFSGVFAGFLQTKSDLQVFDVIFNLVVLAPAIGGLALGFSSRDRKLANPPMVWVAVIWNSIIVAVIFLLIIIGI